MEEEVGKITHFFSKISVGVLKLTEAGLKTGDTIHIKGHTTDFYQKVESMQVEHQPVEAANAGDEVGLKVENPIRENDIVYKVIEEETS